MEKLRDYAGTEDEDDCQNNGEYRKETNSRSDGAARFLRLSRADSLAHQNGDPHGKAGNNHGYGLHQHTAAAYAGDIFRMGELSHHQQIDTAVQGLKKQRQKYGQRETDQGCLLYTSDAADE